MSEEVITQTYTQKIKHFNIFSCFDDNILKEFVNFHRECFDEGVTEAFIYINSPGGSVFVFEGIQAIMNSGEVSYHTINIGAACSAACLLMAQGSFRWAQPNSTFMFHDAASVAWGKMKEIDEMQEVTKKQIEKSMRIFADQTKKSVKWWMDKAYNKKTGDFWFDAREALELGVIDCIGIPTITRNPPVHVDIPINVTTVQKTATDRERKNIKRIEEQFSIEPSSAKKAKKSVKKTTKKQTNKSK